MPATTPDQARATGGDGDADPAAIVGFACRVPGAMNSSKLWENIETQKDVQRKMPRERYNVDAYYHPDGTNKGTTNARYGYFLEQDLAEFDAGFFSISGKEAEAMDPQQRLLLEVVYEALENAGITMAEISGSQTAVYCGSFTNDYDAMITKDLEYYPKYTVTGTGRSILANRISYFYNLHGPSLTIDTACSSSLVGFHLGNQSLKNDESEMCIIVGSALHFDSNIFITMTDLGMLSTDGRCRAFDAAGSGYVRGEGICAVVLKRSSRAEADGDTIRAVVRATGANHDGRKQGITLPAPEAQEALIRRTYRDAGLNAVDTQYFEAHGTGTAAGDPRETQAIGAFFAESRQQPLIVGSIKSNIGHLEGASGLAGLIKTTMALDRGQIPPNMHFNNPNPNIDFENWKIQVPTKTMDWPACDGPRRASINSFGYGGTNAHVVLDAYVPPSKPVIKALPACDTTETPVVSGRSYIVPLSAHSQKAGKLLATSFADYLKGSTDAKVLDLAYTLSTRRSMHRYRSFAVGDSRETLIKDLLTPPPSAAWGPAEDAKPRLGFVFTGQGAQWFAMGRQLIEQSPLFKQTLQRCDNVLGRLPDAPDWSVVDELHKTKETTRLAETKFSQPICTALQLAIVDQFAAWGITPSATVGHSSGEMGAAYAAGILSFENAIIAAYYRGLYMSNGSSDATSARGAMMAVGLTEAEASAELAPYKGRAGIAAVNSPSSITLSGDEDAIVEIKEKLTARKVFARQLQVAQAFHSHHMFPLAPGYRSALENHKTFAGEPAKHRMFSSVTARVADHRKMGADYWVANMTGTVRFSDALTGILLDDTDQKNIDVLLEIGPHAALKGPARQVMSSIQTEVPYLASLTRGVPDYQCLLATAGQLFSLGYPVDLSAVNSDIYRSADGSLCKVMSASRLRDIPSYSWDHSRYWAETRFIKEHCQRSDRHTLLGARVPGSVATRPRWRNYLRPKEIPWLTGHQIEGRTIFPAAGYIAMAIEAAIRLEGKGADIKQMMLKDIVVKSALALPDHDVGTEVILELAPAKVSAKNVSDTWYEFALFSYDDSERCHDHCHGLISVERGAAASIESAASRRSFHDLEQLTDRSIPATKHYRSLHALGLQYGDHFQLISGDVESGPGVAVAPLAFRAADVGRLPADSCVLHPALLDASFHPIFAALEGKLGRPLDEPFVPTFIRALRLSGKLIGKMERPDVEQHFHTCSEVDLSGPRVAVSQLHIQEAHSGDLLVDIEGLEVTALGKETVTDGLGRSLFFRVRWQPAFDFLGEKQEATEHRTMDELVDLFAHQRPDAKILHLTSNPDSVREALSHLGGRNEQRRRFQKLTISSTAQPQSPAMEKVAEEWAGLVELREPLEGEYDLVIVGEEPQMDVKTLLKPTGYVISTQAGVDLADMAPLFKSTNISAWRTSSIQSGVSDPLLIVTASNCSDFTEAVSSSIQRAHGAQVSRATLGEVAQGEVQIPKDIVVLASLDENMFFEGSAGESTHFEMAKRLLTRSDRNIVWVLKGASMDAPSPQQAIVVGLARSARSENEQLKLVVLDLPQASDGDHVCRRVLQALDPGMKEEEIAERDGCLFVPRIEADDDLNCKLRNGARRKPRLEPFIQSRALSLKIGEVGLFETLGFEHDEESLSAPLADDELEIEVKASGLNATDINTAAGTVEGFKLGGECAGVVVDKGKQVGDAFNVGDRVLVWRPQQGSHQRFVRNPASLCYKLRDLPFSVAASLPLSLTTAYYALKDVARLQTGETVLIHSAAGPIGQMAVQYAKHIGAYTIATVASQSERDLLKGHLGLKDEQIFYSGDDSFLAGVIKITRNQGVDVVLNSLTGKLLEASWAAIAPFGRFVEIGKRDIQDKAKVDMEPFRRNVMFASVDLATIYEKNISLGSRVVKECGSLVEQGIIAPPAPLVEYSYAEIEKAFRSVQAGKHIGKVVLVPGGKDLVSVLPPSYRNRSLFKSDKTYLLVGGLGGLGRTLSEWMYRKGARNLAFFSRSGADRPEAQATVSWLQKRGVQVSIHRGDIADYYAVRSCTKSIGKDLAGVFQAAMVLQDTPLEQMTYRQWTTSVGPKVQGTHNLHTATLETDLDFFVCFSSVSGAVGTKAQANYAAANCYLDALMRHRRENGLKGSTMNCGMIVGVGAVAENAELQSIMERLGYDGVNEEELMYQVEEAVTADCSVTIDARGLELHQTITGLNLKKQDYYWCEKASLRNLYANHDYNGAGATTEAGKNLVVSLRSAKDMDECLSLMTAAFIEKLATVLGIGADTIQPGNPLSAYGLDSLVAVELRKWFAKAAGVEIPLFDVLGAKTITALLTKAASLIDRSATTGNDAGAQVQAEDITGHAEETTDSNQLVLVKAERPANLPMSSFQRRLWFMHNFLEDKSMLNLPVTVRMTGTPDVNIMRKTFEELRRRHEILRTAYFEGDDFAEQATIDQTDLELPEVDLSAEKDPEAVLKLYTARLNNAELDIEEGEVMRSTLFKLAEREYALVSIYHHISIDRGSSKTIFEQFMAMYDALAIQQNADAVPPPRLLYADFTLWHNAYLQSGAVETHVKYWKEKLLDAPEVGTLLPFAKAERPAQNDFKRSIHRATLELPILGRLKRICGRTVTTPFQFLLTAFRAFHYRYTEEKDLTVLMVDGNRPHPDVDDVLGFFTNMIPVRCLHEFDVSFDQLLEAVRTNTLEAMAHSELSFDAIVDAVSTDKDPSHSPIGQVAVNYQIHGKMPVISTRDFQVYDVATEDIPTACEIALEAMEDPEKGLHLRLESSSTIYDGDDMERFLENFVTFLTSVVKDHRQPISEIAMCGAQEMAMQSANLWNTTVAENPWNDLSVLEKIVREAESHPDHLAITTSAGDSITYKDLIDKAQRIGYAVREAGVVPGQYVGLLCRPGADAVASAMAILLNRCGYVAMDPEFATERLSFMASDSNTSVILVGDGLEEVARVVSSKADVSPRLLQITSAAVTTRKAEIGRASGGDPFYTIYTSGSTGKPKGVVLTQSNTQQMLSTLAQDYDFSPHDRFLQQSSLSFDLSIVQVFSALTSGGTVCVATSEIRKDPAELARFMQRSRITFTYFTPTQFSLLLDQARDTLRRCKDYRVAFFAGERLPVRVAKAFYDLETLATAYNTWSPSELVVQTTIHKVLYPDQSSVSIPIGFPLRNCRHYVLDSALNPLPEGMIGEICVGGAQVGAGYLNRPQANSNAFVDNPFASAEDRARGWTKLFRTGDRGRFLPDGQLEFHGRIAGDKQIKLRGFRIDLGEVEQRIHLEAPVSGSALVDLSVLARPMDQDDASLGDNRQLIAFIVPKERLDAAKSKDFVSVLHKRLRQHLNEYMLPSGYQFLDSLPVTIGGKVDLQKLLKRSLDLVYPTTPQAPPAKSAESMDAELLGQVTDMFREILKLPKERNIAPTENFFELGGQSILLLRLQAKIKRTLKTQPLLPDLFKAPTPEGVVSAIQRSSRAKPKSKVKVEEKKAPEKKEAATSGQIHWAQETALPNDRRYMVPYGARRQRPSDVTEVLLTGVESFVGLHMLASLLTSEPTTAVHLLGTFRPVDFHNVVTKFHQYRLFSHGLTEETLASRTRCVPGSLTEPSCGLEKRAFRKLGETIHAIYHLGVQVSLLKSYWDLKRVNVESIMDLVELAALGRRLTQINFLSTWSVPHLQAWPLTKRTRETIAFGEEAATHFSPEETDEPGYLKSRWVSEMLFTQAAERGFAVTIFRSSAVTASTATNVQEPKDDFVRSMVASMVKYGSVPTLGSTPRDFVIDFLPVNYLVSTINNLSRTETRPQPSPQQQQQPQSGPKRSPRIFHVTNPNPLPLNKLGSILGDIRDDGQPGQQMDMNSWLDKVIAATDSDEEELQWNVIRTYFEKGHNMFALDASATMEALHQAGAADDDDEVQCPPIDAKFLRWMFRE